MKTILIDMDDTICDYTGSYIFHSKINPDIKYPQSQWGFFRNLIPIEDAIESVNKLREKHKVYILTRPSYKNPLCYTEKRDWIEKYFDLEFCKNLILCYDKSMVKGDYLVDDQIHHGFEGEHIHFGTSKYPDWKTIYNYLI